MARADLRALMRRIAVYEDTELSAAYPARRMARVKVHLCDGRVIEHFQQTRNGDPDSPLSDADLIAKFDELGGAAVEPDVLDGLRTTVLNSDELPGAVAIKQ